MSVSELQVYYVIIWCFDGSVSLERCVLVEKSNGLNSAVNSTPLSWFKSLQEFRRYFWQHNVGFHQVLFWRLPLFSNCALFG